MGDGVEPDRDRHAYETPTGAPCPRYLRLDGTLDGPGACHGCGYCLLLAGLVVQAPRGSS